VAWFSPLLRCYQSQNHFPTSREAVSIARGSLKSSIGSLLEGTCEGALHQLAHFASTLIGGFVNHNLVLLTVQ
jgi:hypothetical protein